MQTLIQTADQLVINFRAKQISQGKVKEPKVRSLNNWNEIRNTILERVYRRMKFTPSDLYPNPGELHEFLTGKVENWVRLNWYIGVAKYRNNFKVK